MGTLCIAIAMATDPKSKGPIAGILPLQGILVGFLAYIVLGETVSLIQMLGVVVAIAGTILMVVADMQDSALQGILFGLLTVTSFGFQNWCIKLANVGKCKPTVINACLLGTSGIIGVIYIIVLFAVGRGVKGLGKRPEALLSAAVAAGLCRALGLFFLGRALRKGPAGVVVTVANASGIGVFVLDLAFFRTTPNVWKLAGMFLCLAGMSLLVIMKPKPKPKG